MDYLKGKKLLKLMRVKINKFEKREYKDRTS